MSISEIYYITQPKVKQIFDLILRSGIVSKFELEDRRPLENNKQELDETLESLIRMGFIAKKGDADLAKYYPTREGLSLRKMIKNNRVHF